MFDQPKLETLSWEANFAVSNEDMGQWTEVKIPFTSGKTSHNRKLLKKRHVYGLSFTYSKFDYATYQKVHYNPKYKDGDFELLIKDIRGYGTAPPVENNWTNLYGFINEDSESGSRLFIRNLWAMF